MIYFPHPCLASYYTTNLIRNNPIFKKSRGVFFLSNFCFQNEKNITGTIGSYTSKAAGDAPITVSKVLRCTSHCVKGPDMHLSLCQRSTDTPLTELKGPAIHLSLSLKTSDLDLPRRKLPKILKFPSLQFQKTV